MPSAQHEAPLLLFREAPSILVRVLDELLGIPLPAYSRLTLGPTDLTTLGPVELRADMSLLLERDDRPVFGVLVEIQRQIDPDKPLA